MMPDLDYDACPVCGKEFREEDRPEWLFLEIRRSLSNDHDTSWVEEDFCSQAHAAQWLAENPLPPVTKSEPYPRTIGDRVLDVAIPGMFFVFLGLMLTGVVAIVRWLA